MPITWNDFDKIWAVSSPLTPYTFSDLNYAAGWDFIGSTPPARQMWDSLQKANDEKFKFLRDNFGTPKMVTTAAQMTDTDKIYVYVGSEAGWNNGHWYYYDAGTSAWVDGGVYNSTAFVTDTTLTEAGKAADAKAVGDALALKADLAGATFTGNVAVNADFSTTGDATVASDLTVSGASTLTGNITAGADITVTGDLSVTNITASGDITADDVTANGNLSVVGNATLNGTSTAVTPAAEDNSTKIATTQYVQTEIKPIETDVTINDKRISNIEKLLEGNLYDYQTDTDSKYTKSVPQGAMPWASLNSVGGKTVVWNQLRNSTYVTLTQDGITTAFDPITGLVTITNNSRTTNYSSGSTQIIIGTLPASALNHKMLITTDNTDVGIAIYVSSTSWVTNSNLNTVFINTSAGGSIQIRVTKDYDFVSAHPIGNTYSFHINIFDLTLMFGNGNEPSTVAEFQQTFPAVWYAYNPGSLLSAGVTEVVSKGKNLANPTEIVVGAYSKLNTHNSNALVRSLQIELKAGDYTASGLDTTITKNFYLKLLTADSNIDKETKSLLASDSSVGYTVPSDGVYSVQFNATNGNSWSTNSFDNFMLEKGSSATPYSPYRKITTPISAPIQALEGYGWSAGSVSNYVDFERKKFVKCVDRVDLGSFNWSKVTSFNIPYFSTTTAVSDAKPPALYSDMPNIIAPNYTTGVFNDVYGANQKDKTVTMVYATSGTAKYLLISDSNASYTDGSAFKTAMDGVYLYYELATPIEVDISEYLTDDNLISVESGGTLTFPNQNGDDYRINVPSAETYMIDLQASL